MNQQLQRTNIHGETNVHGNASAHLGDILHQLTMNMPITLNVNITINDTPTRSQHPEPARRRLRDSLLRTVETKLESSKKFRTLRALSRPLISTARSSLSSNQDDEVVWPQIAKLSFSDRLLLHAWLLFTDFNLREKAMAFMARMIEPLNHSKVYVPNDWEHCESSIELDKPVGVPARVWFGTAMYDMRWKRIDCLT